MQDDDDDGDDDNEEVVERSATSEHAVSLADIVRDLKRSAKPEFGPYERLSKGFSERPPTESSRPNTAFDRMFSIRVGQTAVRIVGNEERTLNILNAISTDVLLEVLGRQGTFGTMGVSGQNGRPLHDSQFRAVVVPGNPETSATLAILDPTLSVNASRIVTGRVGFDEGVLAYAAHGMDQGEFFFRNREVMEVQQLLFSGGAERLAEALWITQPDIVISRRPKMVPLSAPWPCVDIMAGMEKSTAGIFCRDAAGTLGVTGCFHGTGPTGTAVQVGLYDSSVLLANNIQDTVFIPVDPGCNIPASRGGGGVLSGRAPGVSDRVEFHGASSGATTTLITSYDAGLLRNRSTVQLKVQTDADTNTGDSGAALINQDDKVVGFAFERTAFGERPAMTDWIWADNALKALGLTPV